MNKKIIALAGGTGQLGTLIGKALLTKPEVQLRLLVRPGSRDKVPWFEEKNVEIIEGTLEKDKSSVLDMLCEGATAVISAIKGGPEIIIDGQSQLLQSARKAGVKRFIPSDYSLNMFNLMPGQIITSDLKRQFAAIAETERGKVEVVHILSGGFLHKSVLFGFLPIIDLAKKSAYVWGDGKQLMDWTTYEDTALYTAEIAIDNRPIPGKFSIAGDVLSFEAIVRAYEIGSGKKLHVEHLGSLEDLDACIEKLKANPANFHTYLPLVYYRALLSGEGKLGKLMNDWYPRIHLTTLQQYVVQERL